LINTFPLDIVLNSSSSLISFNELSLISKTLPSKLKNSICYLLYSLTQSRWPSAVTVREYKSHLHCEQHRCLMSNVFIISFKCRVIDDIILVILL
jgi:hypothetical protein